MSLIIQYRETSFSVHRPRARGIVPSPLVLSISAAANFGLRDPDTPATSMVLMPTRRAPGTPRLTDLIGFVLREAACSPQRFRDEALNIFLYVPKPSGRRLAASFGLTPSGEFPHNGALLVPALAGHRYKMHSVLHDLSSPIGHGGLENVQMQTGSFPGAADIGSVAQDMAALLRSKRIPACRRASGATGPLLRTAIDERVTP